MRSLLSFFSPHPHPPYVFFDKGCLFLQVLKNALFMFTGWHLLHLVWVSSSLSCLRFTQLLESIAGFVSLPDLAKGHQEASTQSRQDTTTPVMAVVQTAITEFSYFAK